ncbi:AAA family ATPase [Streptomyces chartreusis]|uniref:AAA family ATPase n=2 Tax=Streptomyces chartreusis TaxID=1969 RepID=A0A7H8T188_STRCX|nr:AAA family ATPase [Streptomyces chartreusis]
MSLIMAGYAELESKFHGDGPKNVKAAFHAAESQGALLFIDEADSLLSRRLTDVPQGSEQAINSMRSQIVLCLDQFTAVVVFSMMTPPVPASVVGRLDEMCGRALRGGPLCL